MNNIINISGCGILPKITFVATNGDVLSCCQDSKSKYSLGNIYNNTFNDILIKKKQMIAEDEWLPICKYCDDEYRYLFYDDKIWKSCDNEY